MNQAISKAKKEGKTIVLVTGVFDLLHQEHATFLKKAQATGDILVVGVETDEQVKQTKGNQRPFNSLDKRIKAIKNLDKNFQVLALPYPFNQQHHWDDFMKQLRPNIYAVSSHTQFLPNKKKLVQKYGGQLKIVHRHNPKISTTIIASRSATSN